MFSTREYYHGDRFVSSQDQEPACIYNCIPPESFVCSFSLVWKRQVTIAGEGLHFDVCSTLMAIEQ